MRVSPSDSAASCKGCMQSTRWLLASATASFQEFVISGLPCIVWASENPGCPMTSSWPKKSSVTSKLNIKSSATKRNSAIYEFFPKSLHTYDVNTSRSTKFSQSLGCQVSPKLRCPGVVIWVLQITPSVFTHLQSFQHDDLQTFIRVGIFHVKKRGLL